MCSHDVLVFSLHVFQVASLTEEVGVSREHCEEYRKMSEDNERALRELNETCDQFKREMNSQIEKLKVTPASS